MLGLCSAILGPCWAHVGPSWGILEPCWASVGPSRGSSWPVLALCWGKGAPPQFSFFRFMLFLSKSQKHRKLRGFLVSDHRSVACAGSRIAKARPYRAWGFARLQGLLARFKGLRLTAGRRPSLFFLLLLLFLLLVFACLIPWRVPPCVCRGRRIFSFV